MFSPLGWFGGTRPSPSSGAWISHPRPLRYSLSIMSNCQLIQQMHLQKLWCPKHFYGGKVVRETKILIPERSHSSEGETCRQDKEEKKCKVLDVGSFWHESRWGDGLQIEMSRESHWEGVFEQRARRCDRKDNGKRWEGWSGGRTEEGELEGLKDRGKKHWMGRNGSRSMDQGERQGKKRQGARDWVRGVEKGELEEGRMKIQTNHTWPLVVV